MYITGHELDSINTPYFNRRVIMGALASTIVTAAPVYSSTFGFLRKGGDARRIKMYSGISGESIDIIYAIDGQYISEAISEISYFMRDLRLNKTKLIDTRTLDLIAATFNLMDVSGAYLLLSGYRTKQTNQMLRSRNNDVARNSLHISGQAIDLRHKDRSVKQISRAAASCSAGGVGRYSKSNFVHMDCGKVRIWGV